ncbi:hypothetical protein BBO99_00003871 [Phytophthora kernoviae]|uniref:Rhodanese domain-containing protein n=2 Tax=Phytophthora kernoviae TaxID=325452 RepID=A0A3R7JVC3_9STRA|nr:hypothetical protein G195_004434 [Phytophthora kernoviae 00238/432]KAG2526667.1 hypothetical protein JM16_003576 [Phytophthora kernoviae]KAG2528337.1 hypothetical protein JM18_003282 [Phytophthora kernoviae]RLN37379.1 hypothetical protein BBI17_004000 [Phytophthora kernoviae]RLN81251.1 hypothetical protein BBO99_00003871 [Phytophthora kernoviae]
MRGQEVSTVATDVAQSGGPSKTSYVNSSAYGFCVFPAAQLPELKQRLQQVAATLGNEQLRGTILLSEEGVNIRLSGISDAVDAMKTAIASLHSDIRGLEFKDSYSDRLTLPRMLVKIKKEVISMGISEVNPAMHGLAAHVTAEEFKDWMDHGKDMMILDTRNDYEVRLGTFENAVDLNIKSFRAFPDEARVQLQQVPKEKPIVMFCTGGVRCEKASYALLNEGHKEVYQLEGGILKYFEKVGGAHYKGDCYIFDERVALTPDLTEAATVSCFTFTCQTLKTPQKITATETSTIKCVGICRTLQYATIASTAADDAHSVLQRVSTGQTLSINPPIVGRSKEHQIVRQVMQEDANDGSLFIIGPPGTGKSSSVDQLLTEQNYEVVQAATKKKRGVSNKVAVKLNCSTFADPSALYAAVVEQVRRATSWKVPEQLDPYLLDAFIVAHRQHKSITKHQSVVVVLDEVDQLLRLPVRMQPTVKEVLRFFVRWAAIAPRDVKFLGIMNGVDMYAQVSRIHDESSDAQIPRVIFGSYSHENLLLILQNFVQSAMSFDSTKELVSTYVEARAIELIARKVASRDGDARRAISLLQQCARHALQRSFSADNPDTPVKVTLRDVLQFANCKFLADIRSHRFSHGIGISLSRWFALVAVHSQKSRDTSSDAS